MLPQIMLSGLIFPLSSMAAGVRWLGYVLPLTYFTQITRGVMLRGAPISALWQSFAYLALIGVVVSTLATLRFRRFLAPSPRRAGPGPGPGPDPGYATPPHAGPPGQAGPVAATGTPR
jgi:ABC-2 type transport system permease protein